MPDWDRASKGGRGVASASSASSTSAPQKLVASLPKAGAVLVLRHFASGVASAGGEGFACESIADRLVGEVGRLCLWRFTSPEFIA